VIPRVLSARGLAFRGRLVLLFLLALLPAFIVSLYTSFEHREALQAEAEETTTRLATLTATQLEGILESTYQLLAVLDDDPLILGGGRGCESRFEHVLVTAQNNLTGIALGDSQGRLVCSSPRASGPVALDEILLQRLKAGEDFAIGQASTGPLTGKPVLVAAKAVRHPERTGLAGVVATGIALERISQLPDRASLPPDTIFAVLNQQGRVMTSHPLDRAGGVLPQPPEHVAMILRAGIPGILREQGADGIPRVWGYAPLQVGGGRFFTVVSLREDTLMAQADHVFNDNLVGFALAAGVALLIAGLAGEFFLRRPIEQMQVTAQRIAAGDLSARVALSRAPGELGALSKAIDEMANGLQSREQRLAGLSRRVLEVQEFERRAIARELHDEIGQSLTALKLMLQRHRQADGCANTSSIDELLDITDRTLQQVRGLSLDLRPSMLDHLGLAATLRWYVERESERGGFVVTCRIEPERLRLDAPLETTIFRIAQEALTNVTRHANARTVTVDLMAHGATVELSIRDDGGGFAVDATRERSRQGGSFGLLGMEERAMLAGGMLRIQSGPSGTEVRATFKGAAV
jgi:signal transduction histidine kinase